MTDLISLLDRLWQRWAYAGTALHGELWRRPTRLDGWDVAALYAHSTQWPVAFTQIAEQQVAGPVTYETGAALLAAFNVPGGLAHAAASQVEQLSQDDAAATTPDDLVSRFGETGAASIAALRAMPDGAVVEHPGGATVPLAAACEVAVVEATVHLLDLRAAVGDGVPDVPEDAVTTTRDVLAAIPDPVWLVEAATGRATEPVFPVLR